MNRTTVNISDLSPKAQELYRKIISGEYLMPEPFNSKWRKKKTKIREKIEKEREVMEIPQIFMIVLWGAGLGIEAAHHGERKNENHNFWVTLFAVLVEFGLLTWGGFFK